MSRDAGNPYHLSDNDPRIRAWAEGIKKMTPAQTSAVNTRVARYTSELLALGNLPASKRLGKEPGSESIDDGSPYAKFAAAGTTNNSAVAASEARSQVQVRAAECLVALKLWKYRNTKAPADLAAVTRAAGLPRVPVDSYSGQPLRMVIIDGEPVVYSVGKDGRDDRGRIDSDGDRKAGDHVYRLPAVEKAKR